MQISLGMKTIEKFLLPLAVGDQFCILNLANYITVCGVKVIVEMFNTFAIDEYTRQYHSHASLSHAVTFYNARQLTSYNYS